jgi:ectoine hydroxylase-related dioxygenase (phytanoyl-CoA dioxygenase family)
MVSKILTQAQVDEFNENGVLIIPSFYEVEKIERIQFCIYQIIGLVIDKYNLQITREPFSSSTFDSGYNQLIAVNRDYGADVYDAVKQIPAFIRLVADVRHEAILSQLRKTSLAGIAAGGYGIRVDNPFEEKYRATWHQEYPAQLRSPDGLVYWSPLVQILPELGPVQICLGSHKLGAIPVHTKDPNNPEKKGAYSLVLDKEEELIAKFPHVAPCTKPGDLVVLDFMTLHASGFNKSNVSRWSMQMRYFNFENPIGIKIGWKGSYASGQDFSEIHPELCVS